MLTVTFDKSTMSRKQVQLWYNRFKEGREDVKNGARSGRPNTSTTHENIVAVNKMILDNRRITNWEVADDAGISFASCQASKTVSKLQKFEQKQCRMDIAQKMLMTFNNDPDLLKKVETGDESWMCGYGYHPNGGIQNSEDWNHVKFGQM